MATPTSNVNKASSIDPKSTVLHTRISAAEGSVKNLYKLMQGHVKLDRITAQRHEGCAAQLRTVAAGECFGPMQVAINALANALENQESIRRDILCQRYEDTILTPLSNYARTCFVPAEAMTKDRDATLDAYQSAYTDVQKLAAKNEIQNKKYRRAVEALQSNEQRRKNVDFVFMENAQLFEYQRTTDMKALLQEYIHGHMAFYCQALENMSRIAQMIHTIDPQSAMDELRDILEGKKNFITPTEMGPNSEREAAEATVGLPARKHVDDNANTTQNQTGEGNKNLLSTRSDRGLGRQNSTLSAFSGAKPRTQPNVINEQEEYDTELDELQTPSEQAESVRNRFQNENQAGTRPISYNFSERFDLDQRSEDQTPLHVDTHQDNLRQNRREPFTTTAVSARHRQKNPVNEMRSQTLRPDGKVQNSQQSGTRGEFDEAGNYY